MQTIREEVKGRYATLQPVVDMILGAWNLDLRVNGYSAYNSTPESRLVWFFVDLIPLPMLPDYSNQGKEAN
jgi:hypothetical protein